jgi:hypothetical protein
MPISKGKPNKIGEKPAPTPLDHNESHMGLNPGFRAEKTISNLLRNGLGLYLEMNVTN